MKIINLMPLILPIEYLKNYIQNNSIRNTHAVYTFNQTKERDKEVRFGYQNQKKI